MTPICYNQGVICLWYVTILSMDNIMMYFAAMNIDYFPGLLSTNKSLLLLCSGPCNHMVQNILWTFHQKIKTFVLLLIIFSLHEKYQWHNKNSTHILNSLMTSQSMPACSHGWAMEYAFWVSCGNLAKLWQDSCDFHWCIKWCLVVLIHQSVIVLKGCVLYFGCWWMVFRCSLPVGGWSVEDLWSIWRYLWHG